MSDELNIFIVQKIHTYILHVSSYFMYLTNSDYDDEGSNKMERNSYIYFFYVVYFFYIINHYNIHRCVEICKEIVMSMMMINFNGI